MFGSNIRSLHAVPRSRCIGINSSELCTLLTHDDPHRGRLPHGAFAKNDCESKHAPPSTICHFGARSGPGFVGTAHLSSLLKRGQWSENQSENPGERKAVVAIQYGDADTGCYCRVPLEHSLCSEEAANY